MTRESNSAVPSSVISVGTRPDGLASGRSFSTQGLLDKSSILSARAFSTATARTLRT